MLIELAPVPWAAYQNAYQSCALVGLGADLNAYQIRKPLTICYCVPSISLAHIARILSHFTSCFSFKYEQEAVLLVE